MGFTIKSILAAGVFAFAMSAFDMPPISSAKADVIKDRRALMKTVGKSNKVIKKYKEGEASPDDAIKAARALRKAIKDSLNADLYKKGTTRPDVDPKQTRTKAKAWQDWDGFVKAGEKSAKLTTAFIQLVKAGNHEAAKKAKLGCGGCHKPYRGKKVKKK